MSTVTCQKYMMPQAPGHGNIYGFQLPYGAAPMPRLCSIQRDVFTLYPFYTVPIFTHVTHVTHVTHFHTVPIFTLYPFYTVPILHCTHFTLYPLLPMLPFSHVTHSASNTQLKLHSCGCVTTDKRLLGTTRCLTPLAAPDMKMMQSHTDKVCHAV